MKALMTAAALAALMAASPAFAQSTDMQTPAEPPAATEPAPSAPSMTPPASPPASPGMTAPDTTLPDTSAPDAMSAPDTSAAGDSELFITEQTADDSLASALIGASVKNGADEDLGAINDIVLSDAGTVDALVIGVGGFLGIGEKNVAVSFDAIEKTTDADGNVVLSLETTREQLEAAPAFVTVAEAQQDSEINTPATSDPAAPPAAPAAP